MTSGLPTKLYYISSQLGHNKASRLYFSCAGATAEQSLELFDPRFLLFAFEYMVYLTPQVNKFSPV